MKKITFFILLCCSYSLYGQGDCETINNNIDVWEIVFEDNFTNYPGVNKANAIKLNEKYPEELASNVFDCDPSEPGGDPHCDLNVAMKKDHTVRKVVNDALHLDIVAYGDPSEYDMIELNNDGVVYQYPHKGGYVRVSATDDSSCSSPENNLENNPATTFMFEIRCQMASGDGVKSSFWLNRGPELDIVEYQEAKEDVYLTNLHKVSGAFYGNTKQCGAEYDTDVATLKTDFHTYTAIWDPFKITWFFDGKEIRSTNFHIPRGCSNRMDVIASVRKVGYSGVSSSTPFIIDYIKVWKKTDQTRPEKLNWEKELIVPATTFSSPIVKAKSSLKKVNSAWFGERLLYIGTDNKIHSYKREIVGTYSHWEYDPMNVSTGMNADYLVDIAIEENKIFYKGLDGRIWIYWYDGSIWNNTPACWDFNDVAGDIAPKANGKVFYRGTDNRIYYILKINNNWTRFVTSDVEIQSEIVIDEGTGKIFSIKNNKIWVTWWNPSENKWNTTPTDNSTNIMAYNDLMIDSGNRIYYRGKKPSQQGNYFSHSLFELSKTDTTWWETKEIKQAVFTQTIGRANANAFTEINNVKRKGCQRDDRGRIFYRGIDNNLWICYPIRYDDATYPEYNAESYEMDWNHKTDSTIWNHHRLTEGSDSVLKGLEIDGNYDLYYIGIGNNIYVLEYDGCEVLNGIDYECESEDEVLLGGSGRLMISQEEDNKYELDELKIYPNPVKATLSIDFSDKVEFVGNMKLTVEVVDVLGRVVDNINVNNIVMEYKTNHLPRGIYFIRIQRKNEIFGLNKFIKN